MVENRLILSCVTTLLAPDRKSCDAGNHNFKCLVHLHLLCNTAITSTELRMIWKIVADQVHPAVIPRSAVRSSKTGPPTASVVAAVPTIAVAVISAPRKITTGPSLLTDQSLVVNEVFSHEGLDGLVRGGAAGCGALHGDEHEGDSSDEDEGSLHVVALGSSNFL